MGGLQAVGLPNRRPAGAPQWPLVPILVWRSWNLLPVVWPEMSGKVSREVTCRRITPPAARPVPWSTCAHLDLGPSCLLVFRTLTNALPTTPGPNLRERVPYCF